jgi:alpha-2-macroglobulin
MNHGISAGTALFAVASALLTLTGVFTLAWALESPDATEALKQGNQLLRDGNIAEAAQMYRVVVRDEQAESQQVVEALRNLQQCRNRLGQMAIDQIDDDLAAAVTHHSEDFRVLSILARQLLDTVHMGTVVDGEFTRGYNYGNRGGVAVTGTQVNVLEQDRLQALKWLRQAIDLAEQQAASEAEYDQLRLTLTDGLLLARQGQQAWKLQALTDLSADPDYTDLASTTNYVARYASVDADGQPVLYPMPTDWAAAMNDGERLRWALAPNQESQDSRQRFLCKWAEFLQAQFSVSTLQQDQWLFRAKVSTPDSAAAGGDEQATGVFAIHTLSEDETIARLANGVKRFALPPEYNFIRIYESVAEAEQGGMRETAAWSLVQTFLNRRQYSEAAERIERYLPAASGAQKTQMRQTLADIRKTRFQFDPQPTQLAGQPARLSLIFRNAQQLDFVAHRVDVEKLLLDTKQRYRAKPDLQWFDETKRERLPDLQAPASLFDDDQFEQYLVEQTATWRETVEPRSNHWDRRVQIETPLTTAGLYLVEMRAADGSPRARCLLNIVDTVIVQKPLGEKWLYQVADAASGEPIAGANVEFFGVNRGENRIENFAARTDQQGAVQVALSNEAQWYTRRPDASRTFGLAGF